MTYDPEPSRASQTNQTTTITAADPTEAQKRLTSTGHHVFNLFGSETCKYKEAAGEFLEQCELDGNGLSTFMLLSSPLTWNTLLPNGYGNLMAASALGFTSFLAFVLCLIEMMAMLPFNGGMAVFARAAFGPYVGYFVGSCEAWEYILVAAQGVYLFGSTLSSIFNTNQNYAPLYWLIAIAIMPVLITLESSASRDFAQSPLRLKLLEGFVRDGRNEVFRLFHERVEFFGLGTSGLWTSTYSQPIICEGPKADDLGHVLVYGVISYTIILVPALSPGVANLSVAYDPMIDSFLCTWGLDYLSEGGSVAKALYFFVYLPALVNSMLCYSYATSRQVYALSKVGYYPNFYARVLPGNRSPFNAALLSIGLIVVIALIIQFESGGIVGQALLNGSLLYAIFAYIAVGAAYIRMKLVFPSLKRPFDLGFWFGNLCAIITLVSFTSALVELFLQPVMRETLFVCLGKLGVMTVEFVVYHRFHLVETPEEEFIQHHLGNLADGGNIADEYKDEEGKIDANAYVHNLSKSIISVAKSKRQLHGVAVSGSNLKLPSNVKLPVHDESTAEKTGGFLTLPKQ
ncbi:hypothetical protein BCR33DRAFT_850115 [Rhizoclosmatium globosum]|uniref:Amino acid permease/ SLC12A domain-containing protein n=1 Tax=Rhizoclosmatium globosum TaxID=329046 RepID=A0A1Y2CEB1_9FUNG|nr:hypothetical protein BCR33DRAFT_850115 [Rhizoclosmatium globosum]|eukprot:ORY45266.1 hypothetical protein BCR33DRAFT_850115 [Rhizoclosmatium globosum]